MTLKWALGQFVVQDRNFQGKKFFVPFSTNVHNLMSFITFSGASNARFRLAIAFINFLLGPSGSLSAAMSVSVSNINASKSICSDSKIGCIDERLLATRNLCNGVHSSSVSSSRITRYAFKDNFTIISYILIRINK